MKSSNFAVSLVKYSLIDLVRHLLFWPLWWYSGGLWHTCKSTTRRIGYTWSSLALSVWLKNIFRPMYGQYDLASRLISFLMRFVQIVFRLLIMAAVTAMFAGLFLVYLVLPPLTVWLLIKNYYG